MCIRDRYWRTSIIDDDQLLQGLSELFTETALGQAHQGGLLLPDGPGSLTKPHRDRCIHGDGTIVKPAYKGPKPIKVTDTETGEVTYKYKHSETKELVDDPPTRYDPDARTHHRHDGEIRGTNFVTFSTRTLERNSRLVLGIERTLSLIHI